MSGSRLILKENKAATTSYIDGQGHSNDGIPPLEWTKFEPRVSTPRRRSACQRPLSRPGPYSLPATSPAHCSTRKSVFILHLSTISVSASAPVQRTHERRDRSQHIRGYEHPRSKNSLIYSQPPLARLIYTGLDARTHRHGIGVPSILHPSLRDR